MRVTSSFLLLLLAAATPALSQAPELQIADIGDLTLDSGSILRGVKLGYRADGTLNADRSNAVLFPTWFGGTSSDLYAAGAVAPVDTEKFYLITVDALGNGVSSSPSNSNDFPEITIRDMVRAEHALVTKVLGLSELHAVMGISMGGMQTFEWMTTYPEFMNKAVPIVGSPRLGSYDVLLWETQLEAIAIARELGDVERASGLLGMVSALALQTPKYHAKRTPRSKTERWLESNKSGGGLAVIDIESQLRAMIAIDVGKSYEGSLERAAAAVKAQVLNIVGSHDHMVTPEPAIRFAELLGAESVILDNDCGHLAQSCDGGASNAAVKRFLER